MATEILMPKLGLTMKTGTIVSWLKSEGADVREKEPVLEIETEKLSYNVESPADGVLLKILASEGEKYPVASVLGYVGGQGEAVPGAGGAAIAGAPDGGAPGAQPQTAGTAGADGPADAAGTQNAAAAYSAAAADNPPTAYSGRVFISPLARKMAADLGIDYRQIKGSGPNGRIVKADIDAFKLSGAFTRSGAKQPEPAQHKPLVITSGPAERGKPNSIIPYTGLRRAIGEKMTGAWETIPMVTHQVSADAGALTQYRAMINAGVSEKSECVTIGELLLKLTAVALSAHPVVNSSLTGEGIAVHGRISLGMATATERGLIVPVIHDAAGKGLLTISKEAKDLAARAKNGGLTPDEVSDATFTVSNLGGFGSVDYFTPIINPPQAAILGVGRVADAVVAIDGGPGVRPMVGLSLTYDHRIIDGATAAEFIRTLMDLMAFPVRAAPAIE